MSDESDGAFSETEAPANLVGAFARLLLGTAVRLGVRDVIVSPGSRSTPLAWAALETPGLRTHAVLDERSAAFFALGLARVTGQPPLLICTSGTAAAHYFPAVIEAAHAHLPLLVWTADRPAALQNCDAAQTIDQTRLYGTFARGFFELGEPEAREASFSSAARLVVQAHALSLGPDPGPVHVNVPLRKPLEPRPARTARELALESWVDARITFGPRRLPAERRPTSATIELLSERLRSSRRPLFVLGPAPPEMGRAVAATAEQLGVPLLAELAGHAPSALPLDLVLRRANELPPPDFVLGFGGPCTSAAFGHALARWNAASWIVAEHGFPDPEQRASVVLEGPTVALLRALDANAGGTELATSEHVDAFRKLGAQIRAATARTLVEAAAPDRSLTDPVVVARVLGHPRLAKDEPLHVLLGNSMPLRLADWVGSASARERVRYFVQRGVNGIDGLIATASGLAHADETATLALVGDVTAAHDLSSLALARRSRAPLVLVVIDNGGGRIFDRLPWAREYRAGDAHEEKWRYWSTPPEIDFVRVAEGYGVAGARVTTVSELDARLDEAWTRSGATLLHVVTDTAATDRVLVELGAELARRS